MKPACFEMRRVRGPKAYALNVVVLCRDWHPQRQLLSTESDLRHGRYGATGSFQIVEELTVTSITDQAYGSVDNNQIALVNRSLEQVESDTVWATFVGPRPRCGLWMCRGMFVKSSKARHPFRRRKSNRSRPSGQPEMTTSFESTEMGELLFFASPASTSLLMNSSPSTYLRPLRGLPR